MVTGVVAMHVDRSIRDEEYIPHKVLSGDTNDFVTEGFGGGLKMTENCPILPSEKSFMSPRMHKNFYALFAVAALLSQELTMLPQTP